MSELKWTYLGDGVYVAYNGFHYILITGTPEHIENQIYLEPNVLYQLNEFTTREN